VAEHLLENALPHGPCTDTPPSMISPQFVSMSSSCLYRSAELVAIL
jgi:hypothetical protein